LGPLVGALPRMPPRDGMRVDSLNQSAPAND
jgi:hypothetical protein